MGSTRRQNRTLSERRWRRYAVRALFTWLTETYEGSGRRLDGWVPMRVGQPLDAVIVTSEGVQAWIVPRLTAGLGDYRLGGIVDRLSVVVPEGRASEMVAGLLGSYGVLAVGTVAGKPALLEIRKPQPLPTSGPGALGELLTRDELALLLSRLGRRTSPFAVRSELLAELLDVLPHEMARRHIIDALLS